MGNLREYSRSKSYLSLSAAYTPLIFWIGVLLYMSGSAGSTARTLRRIRPVLEFIFPSFPPETISAMHGYIRKFSHFAGYGILAYLAARSFTSRFESKITWKTAAASVLLAGIVAVADEFRQSREPTRVGSVSDVLIDLSGASFTAILLFLFSNRGASTLRPIQ